MKIKVVDIDTKEELLDVVVEQFVGSFIDGTIEDEGFEGVEGLRKLDAIYGLNLGFYLDGNLEPCVINKFDVISRKIEIQIPTSSEAGYKRKYMRVKIKDDFMIKVKPAFNQFKVTGLDISFGGMLIETRYFFPVGAEIVIELRTIFNKFYFDAKIVNAREVKKGTWHYGVMITETNLRQTQSDALYDYILTWKKKNDLEAAILPQNLKG